MSEETSIERKERKVRVGIVKSSQMDKSIVVATERKVKHSVYGKIQKKTSTFMAHDENNECGHGDLKHIFVCHFVFPDFKMMSHKLFVSKAQRRYSCGLHVERHSDQ